MEVQPAGEVTGLLRAWNAGDEQALQKLTDLVYQDLHRAAHCYMRGERIPHTLQKPPSSMRFIFGWSASSK